MLEAHAMASGMGGMRTAGDLVARMEMTRGMRINEAKEYVANKLNVPVRDLTDPIIMGEVRDELKLGMIQQMPDRPKGIEAKFNIAKLLDIEINSVNKFMQKAGLK